MPLCDPLWDLLFWIPLGSCVFVPSAAPLLPLAGCFAYLGLPGFHKKIFFFFLKTQITNTHIPISEKPCKNCKFCFVPDHVRLCVEPGSSRYVIGLNRFSMVVVCSTYHGLSRSVLCVGDCFIRWQMVHWVWVCWSDWFLWPLKPSFSAYQTRIKAV